MAFSTLDPNELRLVARVASACSQYLINSSLRYGSAFTTGSSLMDLENAISSTSAPNVTSQPKKFLSSEVSPLRRWLKSDADQWQSTVH